ncbi:mycothione reductase [Streptomyces longisporoflavus]|uniref:mycothione reductase n=1 Tax=Streptomyces longisporoflavus TaxID=28044 RepID=UPI00167D1090|nr:mycothione reductase [Streptomyces longisporoflavus]
MTHHDLVVVGAGSGNAVVDDRFAHLDVAMVAQGPFGGTCLNAGCIPSKMLAATADIANTVRDSARHNVLAQLEEINWPGVQRRVFGRLDAQARDGEQGRRETPWMTVYRGHAHFTGDRELQVTTDAGSEHITADRIVVAAGSRPTAPPAITDSGLPYETSDTVMRLDKVPERLIVVGGGYIAAELAHVFHTAGAGITIVEQGERLLTPQDESVSRAFTDSARARWDLRLGREVTGVHGTPGDLTVTLDDGTRLGADTLLVAVGRRSNADTLHIDKAGIASDEQGLITVDEQLRTSAPGVWALGDVTDGGPALKHVANRQAEVIAHNLLHPDRPREMSYRVVPAAVFAEPQIGQVGLTEQEARERGIDFVVGRRDYQDIAYGWALENTQGFCKILVERDTGTIIGAHVLGPQAATLIQPLVLAMTWRLPARDVAERPLWPHPALTEAVENALREAIENCAQGEAD